MFIVAKEMLCRVPGVSAVGVVFFFTPERRRRGGT